MHLLLLSIAARISRRQRQKCSTRRRCAALHLPLKAHTAFALNSDTDTVQRWHFPPAALQEPGLLWAAFQICPPLSLHICHTPPAPVHAVLWSQALMWSGLPANGAKLFHLELHVAAAGLSLDARQIKQGVTALRAACHCQHKVWGCRHGRAGGAGQQREGVSLLRLWTNATRPMRAGDSTCCLLLAVLEAWPKTARSASARQAQGAL